MKRYIDIVFDKIPGPDSAKFIEVEDSDGKSFRAGKWVDLPNGAALRIPDYRYLLEVLQEISKGEGRYSMNQLEHASNTIEDMKALARKAVIEANYENECTCHILEPCDHCCEMHNWTKDK
ncbi:MAG: hypothetical protein H8D23_18810 [Candidatus Brocadiales bacterium]|nr:hypothetical protein [Candidatus Brocadiales bacterium]